MNLVPTEQLSNRTMRNPCRHQTPPSPPPAPHHAQAQHPRESLYILDKVDATWQTDGPLHERGLTHVGVSL